MRVERQSTRVSQLAGAQKEPDLHTKPRQTACSAEPLPDRPANEYILPQWSDILLLDNTVATVEWRTDTDNSVSSLPLNRSREWSEGVDDGYRGSLANSIHCQSHNDHNLAEPNPDNPPINLV
jgi:hypothetical protein